MRAQRVRGGVRVRTKAGKTARGGAPRKIKAEQVVERRQVKQTHPFLYNSFIYGLVLLLLLLFGLYYRYPLAY